MSSLGREGKLPAIDIEDVCEYFGGDLDMASMFLNLLNSDVASGSTCAAIATKYFRGDAVTARNFCALAAQTKEQCREAEAKRGRKDAEMAKIAKDTSAALMAKRVLKAQERAKKEAARLGSEPPSPLTPGAGAHHGSGGASPDQKLRRTDGKGGKFQTQSLHDKQLDREKEVQRIMDLLRALENARLPTGQGYMQLQDAVRPRSYTHEVLKNAGLKYRRGRPVFENDVGAKRSASALACVDVPDASGRYREQGSNMAVVDRFSRSFTPSANERQGASAHRSTSPRHHGILRSKSRRATLAPLAGVKQPPLLSEDILSFSLPILCKSKASETSELAEATREPDEQQKHQDQIAADLEDDDAMVERGPDNVAKQRVKDSKAQLAKRIAFRVDEDAIVLNKQASHSAVIKKIVLHDGEARDAMRRVENILGDLFGIDVRQYAIPIRVTDDHTEIKALVAAQKTRLNAGILDVQPRYVCVRSEISIPKGMGRHLHTMAYNNKKQGGSVQDAGFSDKLASSRELEQNLEVKLAEIKHETPGLKWEDIGEKRPATGTEMSCSQLESALHDRTVFTKGELQKFGATRVSFESYIKVGETYFKPSGGERAAMTRQGEAELDSIRNSIGKFRKEEQLLRAKQRREGGEQRGAAAGAKLPPMDYQRVKIEASSARAHARVHRDVKEIVVVRGMSLYQLSAEIAKAVGSAFLFLEHYDGLDASTEGAFCELCSYLWAKEEKSQVQATAEKHQYIIAERECELAYTNEELKVLEVEVKEAHKEREEADAAELHAKKALASAKDAVKYGWPGAERKMAAAKQAEIDAARELEEAIEAESKTIGKQYPEGVEKQRHVSAELVKQRLELAETEAAIGAYSMYMLAQENNPHPIYGEAFRRALLGFESVERKMRPFLEHLQEHAELIQPRPKSQEEIEAEEMERMRLLQEEHDLQAAAQKERLGTLFGRINDRLNSAPPGAPGMPAILSYEEPFVHVTAEPAKSFDQEVLDNLDDKMRSSGTGGLTASELAEYCAMTVRGEHNQAYCFEVGESSLKEAKTLRFQGELDAASTALTRSNAAFGHAGPRASEHTGELEFLGKQVAREVSQLNKGISCQSLAHKAMMDGSLVVFRRYWNDAKSLYESCGAVAKKPQYLPTLMEWDALVQDQEKDVKDMTDAITETRKALEKFDMVVAAEQVNLANSLTEKCGKAGVELGAQAKELLRTVRTALDDQRKQQEAVCRTAIVTEKFSQADNAVVEIWKCCRLVAIAQGDVQSAADNKALVACEKKQAKLLGSSVVSLGEELAGTKEQHAAVSILGDIDLVSWPADDSKVPAMRAKASDALEHITKARNHLETAATEQANGKILALQPVEMDLALRVHKNDVVKKLLGPAGEKPNGQPFNGLPYLCTGAAANNVAALQMLLDASGDVNLLDHKSNTPVHHAVQSKAWDALQLLGKHRKTNPNKVNADGHSPLHLAVLGRASAPTGPNARSMFRKVTTQKGKLGLMDTITNLKAQADSSSHSEAVRILLSDFWKINPNLKAGKYETTALHLAGELSNFDAQEILLKSAKTDPNIRDNRGWSALVAAIWIKKDISRFLACARVDVNLAIPKNGWSPLHVCIVKDSLMCMESLLACPRVNVSSEDLCGLSAVHLAAHADVQHVIEMLLKVEAVQDAGGPQLVHLMQTVRRFHARGDPSFWGLWTQASRELLELLPSLLLELRMWDQLHDTICNAAFATTVIENFGIDYMMALFAEASDLLDKFEGVQQDIRHDFTQYQNVLEKYSEDIRTAKTSFTTLATEHHLWGVRNAQHSVSHVIEVVDGIRAEVASKTKKEAEAFFECLAYKEEVEKISKVSLEKILSTQRSFHRTQSFIKQLYETSQCTLEELDAHCNRAIKAIKHDNIQSQETAIRQLASLFSITKNQEETMALRVQMKQTIDVSKIKSRLCEMLSAVLPNNEQHVLLRVVRVYLHLGKINAVIMLSKNPVKSSLSFGEGRLLKSLNAIVDSFRGKSNDARLRPVVEELKILSVTAIDPSVFVVMDLIAPSSTTRQFASKQDFASQVLNDIRNASNLQPNLIRIAKISQSWNHVVVELLHDDINPAKSLSKNRVMAERLVSMAYSPSTVLHRGIATQHIACCLSLEGHIVPRFEGEWQDFHVRVMGSSIAMHNELRLLDEVILPAARSLASLHNCYVSWTVSQDDMMSPNMKKLGHNLHDMELHETETEIVIGLVGDRYGSIVDIDGKKTSSMEFDISANFLQIPDWREVFVFMRDIEGLEEGGFPHQYKKTMTDQDQPEQYALLKNFKTELNKYNGKRTNHYTPTVKGFHLDVEHALSEATEAARSWEGSKERLDTLKASTPESSDVFTQYAIKITENRMREMRESCGRWIRVLRAEEQRGSVPSSILEAAAELAKCPMFETQPEPKMDLSADPSDVRLALGLELDADIEMFHVGLAVVDSVKARGAPVVLKPPFHSHLQHRELLENIRLAYSDQFSMEEDSSLHKTLKQLEAAICPATVQRTRSTGQNKSGEGVERALSNPRAPKPPIVLLTGGPGAGKTSTLALLSKQILTARFQNESSREAPDLQVYFKMTNKHNFGSALRYLNSELAVQMYGRDGLKQHDAHMGNWEEEGARLKKSIAALPPGTRVVFLLDGLGAEHRQALAELLLSVAHPPDGQISELSIQAVMCAESGAAFNPNTVPEGDLAIFDLGGLSPKEQDMVLSNFGTNFSSRKLTDAEKKYVVGKEIAQNPLYLNVYALTCVIKPAWITEELTLPDNVAKIFKLFVVPFLSDWLRIPAKVVEATLEVAQMNMRGIRLDSMHLEVQGLLPPELRGEASLSKMSVMVGLLAPIWRQSRTLDGLVALEHPSIVEMLSGSAGIAKAMHLADSSLQPRASHKHRASISTALDTDNTDPKLLERLETLKKHQLELFNLHSTRPIFLALQSEESWKLTSSGTAQQVAPDASMQSVPSTTTSTESGYDAAFEWQSAMQIGIVEPSIESFSLKSLCHNDTAMDPSEAIADAFRKWNARAERLLSEYELTDDSGNAKPEQKFDACYNQMLRVMGLAKWLSDPDFVIAGAGLQLVGTLWNVDDMQGPGDDSAPDLDTDDRALANSISDCLLRYKKLSACILQEQDVLEDRCWDLAEKLVIHCKNRWNQGMLSPSKIRETLGQLVYDSVADFRGQVELMYRRATALEKDKGDSFLWKDLTQAVIRESCEDLNKRLNEDVTRIFDMVAKKREQDFVSGLALAHEKLQAQQLFDALDAYEVVRACGRYPVDIIDKVDPNNKEAHLVELWGLKSQLDRACDQLATCAATSQAFGPAFAIEDAIVGIPSLIILQSRNKRGENLEVGGEMAGWVIGIKDKHGEIEFDFTDNDNGTYEIKFVPRYEEGCTLSIAFRLGIKAQAKSLKGSPFQLKFRRDSFWSFKTVAEMPRNLGGRILFAASDEDACLLDVRRQELCRFYPDGNTDDNVWKCQKMSFAGEDFDGRGIKGFFSVSKRQYVAYTNSLSSLYAGFADSFYSLDVDKEAGRLSMTQLVVFEQDPPLGLVQKFAPLRPWPWSTQSCKNLDKVAGVPEFVDQANASQLPEPAAGTDSTGISDSRPGIQRNDSVLYDTALPGVEKAKFSKVAIKGSSNRYEDFSLPVIVVSAPAGAASAEPVAILLTHFDQYSRAWRKRQSAVYSDGKLVIFGGLGENSKVLSCYQRQDADKEKSPPEYEMIEPSGRIPCKRCNFFLALSGKHVILHGGIDEKERVLNDIYLYDLEQNRWERMLSLAIKSSVASSYAAGANSILSLSRGTTHMQLRVLNVDKISRRSSLSMCGKLVMQITVKARRSIRNIQAGMNLRDSWLLRLAVFKALNTDLEPMLRNVSETMTYIELHEELLHPFDFTVQELNEDLQEAQQMYLDMVRLATELRSKLKKSSLPERPHIEHCCRLRAKHMKIYNVTRDAEFTRVATGYENAVRGIEYSRKYLEKFKAECVTVEDQLAFYGDLNSMEEEKRIIEDQLDLLGAFRDAWNLYRDLFNWADIHLSHSQMLDTASVEDMNERLQDLKNDKMLSSELFGVLSASIQDCLSAQRFVELMKLNPGSPEDAWLAARVLCALTRRVLNPATLATMLKMRTFQEARVKEFIASAESSSVDEAMLMVNTDAILLSGELKYATGVAEGVVDKSMHSSTCFCQIKSIRRKSLARRSAIHFRSQSRQETINPELRVIISKARMGKLKEFKEILEHDPSLWTRAVDANGNALVHIAAANGQKKIIKELMRNAEKIDLYARNGKGKNALDLATDFKYVELAEYLKDKLPALAEPGQVPVEKEKTSQHKDNLYGIRLDFVMHGIPPAALRIVEESQSLQQGTQRIQRGKGRWAIAAALKWAARMMSLAVKPQDLASFEKIAEWLARQDKLKTMLGPFCLPTSWDNVGTEVPSMQWLSSLSGDELKELATKLSLQTEADASLKLIAETVHEASRARRAAYENNVRCIHEYVLSVEQQAELAKDENDRTHGGLAIPGGSAYLRTGTNAAFTTYAPVKIKASSSGKQLGSPIDVSAWFVVGEETGPWFFSYGDRFTEICLVERPKTAGQTAADELQCHSLEQAPLQINIENDVATATVSKVLASQGVSGSEKPHYSLSEFMAEFASYGHRASELQAVASRDAEESRASERCRVENERIVRDAMNRPVVVDGMVRGVALNSILCAHHRDALGRIVVVDGIHRNAHAPETGQADWGSLADFLEDVSGDTSALQHPQLQTLSSSAPTGDPAVLQSLSDLASAGQALLEVLPRAAGDDVVASLVNSDTFVANALRTHILPRNLSQNEPA